MKKTLLKIKCFNLSFLQKHKQKDYMHDELNYSFYFLKNKIIIKLN